MFARSIAFIAGLAVLSGCSSYQKPEPAFHEELVKPYTLAASDEVRVIVFGQPDLSNTYKVDQGGSLAFPLIGQVTAKNKTPKQLAAIIRARLKNGYIRDPDVSVEVATYRPVFIMGEVRNAGQYSFLPGMTAQNAIATAGGFTSRANQGGVDLTRQINGEIMSDMVPITAPLRPGDTIYIRERLI